MDRLDDLLDHVVEADASDLLLKQERRPAIRTSQGIQWLDADPWTAEESRELLNALLDGAMPHLRARAEMGEEVDLAYDGGDLGRFRVNVFKQQGCLGFAMRRLKPDVPSFEDLRLPGEILRKLAGLRRGLVLVTGVTGSGKSTTLAAMVDHLNTTSARHVITVEDPIEFVHDDDKCLITQREIGMDTKDFPTALKYAMREAPDVILIGEMRDMETMEAAINAAETGHLVLSTLHTVNAQQTVERILNFFPPHQHNTIRMQLSLVLEGIISQRLLKRADGAGWVPAVETLVASPHVRELILKGETTSLEKAVEEGEYWGSMSFNQSLKQLVDDNLVTEEDALAGSDRPDDLRLALRGVKSGSQVSGGEAVFERRRADKHKF